MLDKLCNNCGKKIWKYSTKGFCLICFNKLIKTITKPRYCVDCGKQLNKYNKETIRCYSCNRKNYFKFHSQKGNLNNNFKDAKIKIHCSVCNKLFSIWKKQLNKKRFRSLKCTGIWRAKTFLGKNHSNYIHGEGNFPYPSEFNDTLKDTIRKRDNYQCQNPSCGMTEEEHIIVYGRVLPIHHIDYIKENCISNNLITLCDGCNIRANFNRDYWQEFYKNKILEKQP